MKLVKLEAESPALRRFLRRHREDRRVTSALATVEVVRALAGGGPAAVAHARRQLGRVDQVNLDRQLLDQAVTVAPGVLLRSLDAIHLASALAVGLDLRAVVTYDQRLGEAARTLNLLVEQPA